MQIVLGTGYDESRAKAVFEEDYDRSQYCPDEEDKYLFLQIDQSVFFYGQYWTGCEVADLKEFNLYSRSQGKENKRR